MLDHDMQLGIKIRKTVEVFLSEPTGIIITKLGVILALVTFYTSKIFVGKQYER